MDLPQLALPQFVLQDNESSTTNDTDTTTTTNNNNEETDPTTSFLTNFGIGIIIFLSAMFFYDLLRYYFPGHCYCRATAASNPANNDYDGSKLQSPEQPPPYPLSWVLRTIRYPFEKIVETHGLDVAMYLRFLQTQATIFFALTIYTSIVLIPTYATVKVDYANNKNYPLGLERATLAVVPDRSSRLWVTLVSEIAVVAIILILLYLDIKVFTKCRIKYRSDNKKNPSNFAVLVMDIPQESRDQSYLFNVFNSIFPGQVIAVHPMRDAHHLLTLKTRYISAVNKRQRIQLSTAPSTSPTTVPPEFSLSSNDADNDQQREQQPTNENPHAENNSNINNSSNNHIGAQVGFDLGNAVTIPVSSYPTAYDEEENVTFPDMRMANPISGIPTQSFSQDFNGNHFDYGNLSDNNGHTKDRGDETTPPNPVSGRSSFSFQVPSPRLRALTRTDSDQIAQYDRHVKKARDLLVAVEKDIDRNAPVTHAAFVVFRSKVATTCAVAAPIFPSAVQFKVSRAPDPRSINWNRINISRYTTRIRSYISFSVLTTLTLLWTIPSSFIQALGNLTALGDALNDRGTSFLKLFVENNPGFTRFLEAFLPPVLLFLILILIPQVMRFVISFERIPSQVQAENKVRNYLFFFYVMSNFVYQVALGAVLDQIEDIVNDPRELVSFLSTSVPGQASFLMKYVLTNSFIGSILGMLNIGRLIFRPLVIWRAKTEREQINADRMFADYPFAKMYALCTMISLISYVYATIAPIMNAVAFLYFSLAYLCSKQVLLYSHRPMFEGGGYLFRDAWAGLLIGLYVHQLSMIGIFSLKKAPIQAILAVISFIFSIWFTLLCRRRFSSRVENGSLLRQCPSGDGSEDGDSHDERNGLCGGEKVEEIPKQFSNMYVHPGLKPVEVLENTSMDPATASLTRRSSRRSNRPPEGLIESYHAVNSISN